MLLRRHKKQYVNPILNESSMNQMVQASQHKRSKLFAVVCHALLCIVVANSGRSRYLKIVQMEPSVDHNKHQLCHFDGECPVGMTCAVAPTTDAFGVCERFVPSISTTTSHDASRLQACVAACLPELQLDEYFTQERWPIVKETRSVKSNGRPDGCLLTYTREVERGQNVPEDLDTVWNEISPRMLRWNQTRLRHVVRIDPSDERNLLDTQWNAYCFQPCQKDADCRTARESHLPDQTQGFICDKGACQRNPKYWDADVDPASRPEMVFVTGASRSYFASLQNLAASIRYWAPRHKLVVYNLGGLDARMINEIQSWPNVIALEWREGIPDYFPPHVRVGKQYAWKPIIIHGSLLKYKAIFWLDAGSTLTGPVEPTEQILHRDGIFLVKGQDLDMKPMSHNKTFDWFNATKSEKFEGHYSGNTQAYLYPSRYFETIVVKNRICALEVGCIAPEGSTHLNHRYDQTTLSILAYHQKLQVPHHTEHVALSRYQLSQDLETASHRFIWTARQECTFYVEREEMLNST